MKKSVSAGTIFVLILVAAKLWMGIGKITAENTRTYNSTLIAGIAGAFSTSTLGPTWDLPTWDLPTWTPRPTQTPTLIMCPNVPIDSTLLTPSANRAPCLSDDVAYAEYISGRYETVEELNAAYSRYLDNAFSDPSCRPAEVAEYAQLLAPFFQSSKEEQAKTCADVLELVDECPPAGTWGYNPELFQVLYTECSIRAETP